MPGPVSGTGCPQGTGQVQTPPLRALGLDTHLSSPGSTPGMTLLRKSPAGMGLQRHRRPHKTRWPPARQPSTAENIVGVRMCVVSHWGEPPMPKTPLWKTRGKWSWEYAKVQRVCCFTIPGTQVLNKYFFRLMDE